MPLKTEIETLAADLRWFCARLGPCHIVTPTCLSWAERLDQIAAGLPEWQPIETAPHEEPVLVLYLNALGHFRIVKAAYFDAGRLEMDDSVPDDAVDEEGRNVSDGWYADSDHHDPGYMPMTEEVIAWTTYQLYLSAFSTTDETHAIKTASDAFLAALNSI